MLNNFAHLPATFGVTVAMGPEITWVISAIIFKHILIALGHPNWVQDFQVSELWLGIGSAALRAPPKPQRPDGLKAWLA